MNRKENILALYHHQPLQHVPNFMTDIYGTGGDKETFDCGPAGGGLDGFGVMWQGTSSAMGAGVPGQAREQLKNFDPKNQIQEYGFFNGHFLRLMHLMGFENGLIAMATEPEACKDLMEAITDYRIQAVDYVAKYFKPDSICLFDDFATERGLFISPKNYRELIKPYHKKLFDAIKSYDIIPNMHVCGVCQDVVEDFLDEGIAAWEICQPENDLIGLQKKVGDRLAFLGGYDMIGENSYKDVSEEELRASVRETIDKYAPGGNYGLIGMIMFADPMKMLNTMSIMSDECIKYGTNYFG